MTAEQLWRMPSDDMRHELVRGELRTMAPAGFEHGAIIVNLSLLLAQHVRKHKLGVVAGAETGFILTQQPDTVRGADVAFVRAARIPKGALPKKFWLGAPDLAVEVLSPDDRPRNLARKVNDYLTAGAQLVWGVSPRRKTVAVYQPMTKPVTLKADDILEGGDVVKGFACRVADLFE
jgi:Uma2 family endonuclease